jgi:ABC-type spermidine/putrescine transport system permease subunit I
VIVASISLIFGRVAAFVIARVEEAHHLATLVTFEPRDITVSLAVCALVFLLGYVGLVNGETNVASRASAFDNVGNDAGTFMSLVLL